MYLCNYIIYVHSLVLSMYLCIVPAYLLELFTNQVFLVCIGWYFLGIVPTDTKENLVGTFWYQKNGGSPFSSPKRGALDPFQSTQPPIWGEKGFPPIKKKCSQKLQKSVGVFLSWRTHRVSNTLGACHNSFFVFVSNRSRSRLTKNLVWICFFQSFVL